MVKRDGYQAMITQHSWMFLSSYEKLRTKLQMVDIINMAHLGARAFEEIGGEVVQTTSFVIRNNHQNKYNGMYCRLIEPTTQKGKEEMYLSGENCYTAEQDNFTKIPGSPVAYWVNKKIFSVFQNKTLNGYYNVKAGMCTGANALFILLWYEVNYLYTSMYSGKNYLYTAHNKGGEYRRWYGNRELILKYNSKALIEMKKNEGFRHDGKDFYFKEHIGWSKITSSKSSFRYFEEGFTFDSAGLGLFANSEQNIYVTLGFLNSKIAEELIALLNPTLNVTPMVIKKLPYTESKWTLLIEKIVKSNIEICKADWDSFEISWDFTQHPLICCSSFSMQKMREDEKKQIKEINCIEDAFVNWKNECFLRFSQLKSNEEELNRIFIDIYGLQDELTPEVEDKDVTVRKADLQRDIKSLISYAVGCMFGRYSLDVKGIAYAGGEWDDNKYSTFIPDKDNIIPITDEEYFEDDILGLFCGWLKKVYGKDTLEENLDFIASALGNKGNTSRDIIRNYFVNDFFKDHCAAYSVTGSGKRPIYWLFDSGKQNGFKALIYLHRYNADTIGNLRVDYLHRMQRIYESEIERMQDMIEHSTNTREGGTAAKRKEKLQKQIKECRDYDEKIGHLALSRIELDLDDGVKINYGKVQTAKDGQKYQVLAKI